MKERDLNILARERLESLGYFYWFPHNTWGERDVFGVFDFIAIKRKYVMFVQITTIDHVSHRFHKINNFFHDYDVEISSAFIWAWNKKVGKFKIIRVKKSGGLGGRSPDRSPATTGGPSASAHE
jgi:hypothetical protein